MLGMNFWISEYFVDPKNISRTICSVTLNGVFRSHGIPMAARFGGLLELHDRQPVRFSQIINYDGTTIDPIEIFIRGRMTRVAEAARTGTGVIGAGFRARRGACRARNRLCRSAMPELAVESEFDSAAGNAGGGAAPAWRRSNSMRDRGTLMRPAPPAADRE